MGITTKLSANMKIMCNENLLNKSFEVTLSFSGILEYNLEAIFFMKFILFNFRRTII